MTIGIELPLGSCSPGGYAWDGSVAAAEVIVDHAADVGIDDVHWDQEHVGPTGWERDIQE